MAKVLVVDDSEDLRKSIAEVLEAFGFQTVSVSTTDEAFARSRQRDIDAVVTDIMMHGGPTGLDLITRIRSDLQPPVPPVVACSGFPDLRDEAMRRGAAAFLVKPFAMVDLREAVEGAIAGRPEEASRARAHAERSRVYRDRAALEAEALLRELTHGQPDFHKRAQWGARWGAAYFGVGHAIMVGLVDGLLKIEASNEDEILPVGATVEEQLPLCRDVLESHASLVLPDVSAFAPLASKRGTLPVRSFAAVPLLTPKGVACGALCAFDEQPRRVDGDDLAIMEMFGHRISMALRDPGTRLDEMALFESEDLLTHHAFAELLGIELLRAQRCSGYLELAVMCLAHRARDGVWLDAMSRIGLGQRRALGSLSADRLALFVAADRPEAAAEQVAGAWQNARSLLGVRGAGVVALAGAEVPAINEHGLVYLADMLASRSSSGKLERLVVRAEPWSGYHAGA
jgi:CheY-like chemotaxis protein